MASILGVKPSSAATCGPDALAEARDDADAGDDDVALSHEIESVLSAPPRGGTSAEAGYHAGISEPSPIRAIWLRIRVAMSAGNAVSAKRSEALATSLPSTRIFAFVAA